MAKKTWMGRAAGVLLPVSSLPSKYGIGNFGQAAVSGMDFLVQAEQRYWQVLPLGPTSFGDSPYQSYSAFAGEPLYIDLDQLAEAGLLKKAPASGWSGGRTPLMWTMMWCAPAGKSCCARLLKTLRTKRPWRRSARKRGVGGGLRPLHGSEGQEQGPPPGPSGRRGCACGTPPPWRSAGKSTRRTWTTTSLPSTCSSSSGAP